MNITNHTKKTRNLVAFKHTNNKLHFRKNQNSLLLSDSST